MERRAPAKPFREALANYPQHKEELERLPRKYDAVFARYPYKRGTYLMEEEDFFQELVLHCKEADLLSRGTFLERVCKRIDAIIHTETCIWTNATVRANVHLVSGWISANTGNNKVNGRLKQ